LIGTCAEEVFKLWGIEGILEKGAWGERKGEFEWGGGVARSNSEGKEGKRETIQRGNFRVSW